MNKFLEWIALKIRLDAAETMMPLVSEGQIWWAHIGENIGREISGKNEDFSRPVLIYKKLSRDFYFIIPFTSQAHTGSWFVTYFHKPTGKNMYACLHQARSIDYRRIDKLFTEMGLDDFAMIQTAFSNLYSKR